MRTASSSSPLLCPTAAPISPFPLPSLFCHPGLTVRAPPPPSKRLFLCCLELPNGRTDERRHALQDYYCSVDALEFDCNLVYANCAKYNLPGSDIVKLALAVSDRLVQAIKAISEPGGAGGAGAGDDGAAAGGGSSSFSAEVDGAGGGGSGSGGGGGSNGTAAGLQRSRQRSGSRNSSAAVRWGEEEEEDEEGEGRSRFARHGKRKRARTGRGRSDSGMKWYPCMHLVYIRDRFYFVIFSCPRGLWRLDTCMPLSAFKLSFACVWAGVPGRSS